MKLANILKTDTQSWNDFYEQNEIKGFYEVTFKHGNLIEVNTKNQLVLDWAKSRGLK